MDVILSCFVMISRIPLRIMSVRTECVVSFEPTKLTKASTGYTASLWISSWCDQTMELGELRFITDTPDAEDT